MAKPSQASKQVVPLMLAVATHRNGRYPVYLESKAYSGSLRFKLSCGSVLMMNKPDYREFWVRDLQPGVHYVEIEQADASALCENLAEKVRGAHLVQAGPFGPRVTARPPMVVQ